jgi:hypothetical protein
VRHHRDKGENRGPKEMKSALQALSKFPLVNRAIIEFGAQFIVAVAWALYQAHLAPHNPISVFIEKFFITFFFVSFFVGQFFRIRHQAGLSEDLKALKDQSTQIVRLEGTLETIRSLVTDLLGRTSADDPAIKPAIEGLSKASQAASSEVSALRAANTATTAAISSWYLDQNWPMILPRFNRMALESASNWEPRPPEPMHSMEELMKKEPPPSALPVNTPMHSMEELMKEPPPSAVVPETTPMTHQSTQQPAKHKEGEGGG